MGLSLPLLRLRATQPRDRGRLPPPAAEPRVRPPWPGAASAQALATPAVAKTTPRGPSHRSRVRADPMPAAPGASIRDTTRSSAAGPGTCARGGRNPVEGRAPTPPALARQRGPPAAGRCRRARRAAPTSPARSKRGSLLTSATPQTPGPRGKQPAHPARLHQGTAAVPHAISPLHRPGPGAALPRCIGSLRRLRSKMTLVSQRERLREGPN